ncbi:hypothetical protein JCM19236_5863 [Vibrio sp. JCM 19236]|nr:hypothetical protein JCM19236_5863 [Vibrio sp. JCM 19236]
MNSVQSSVANSYIDDVELITNNPNCENYHSDGNGTAFQANGELALCSFQYYVKNERDASADASAYSVVFAPRIGDSKLDYFTPLSRVGLLSTKVSISLKDELEAEIPIGYRLEESSVSVLGQGKVEIAANDTLEFSSDYEGISRIVYGYTNDVDMIIGMVTIAISDGVNSLPVADDFTYSDVVDVSASVTIDVRDYISDPDNDPLQLVFVDTWNADVFSTEPENIGNTRFTFKADVAGSHIVTYAISDHRGGYSIGLIEVKVIDPAGLGSWGDIDVDKLHFYHPMTREEAVSEGEEYFGIFLETGSSATWAVTTYNVSLAEQLCGPKGHIPSTDEMEQLASVGGVGVSLYDNWPVGNAYLVKDGSSYSAADISGTTVLSGSIPPLGAYVTCAALGEFEVVDSLSRTEDIVANDVDVAKITVSVRMNGVAVTGANVFAEVASGDSSIGIEALNDVTDSEGHAAFEIKSTKAETAQIRLTWGDQEIRQNVTFIGDKETAVISDMLVIKDNAPSVGGSFDEVRASVQDAYNNTIEGQSVEFDTSNIADTYFENVQVKTDSNGHATNKVFWQGPEDYIENQYATIGASTYSTNAGTTSQTTTVTFVSGTLKSFEPVINDQSYNKETSFEAYVEQGDGSPAANRLVRFETYANDAGIVDGEKKAVMVGIRKS